MSSIMCDWQRIRLESHNLEILTSLDWLPFLYPGRQSNTNVRRWHHKSSKSNLHSTLLRTMLDTKPKYIFQSIILDIHGQRILQINHNYKMISNIKQYLTVFFIIFCSCFESEDNSLAIKCAKMKDMNLYV